MNFTPFSVSKISGSPVTLREILYVILYLSSLLLGINQINKDIVRLETRIETMSARIDQILLASSGDSGDH